METFGERIKELRKDRGIPVHEMAMKLGISRNTLTNWERGEKEPHAVEILNNMANILQVPLENLLTGESESRIENNSVSSVISRLDERVTRLEQIFSLIRK